jgi:outer membrane protein assembly factor BamB
MAVRPGVEKGEGTEVVWKFHKGVPECPSPLVHDGRVYMVKNGGMITCLDAKTGTLKYRERLGAGGPYYASPVAGDGKIYAASARGMVCVLEAGDSLKVLSRNNLKERIMASPAILDGKLYFRTEQHLFAFGLDGEDY